MILILSFNSLLLVVSSNEPSQGQVTFKIIIVKTSLVYAVSSSLCLPSQ